MHVQHILQGARILASNRRLWQYIWVPLLVSAAVFIAIVVAGFFLVVPALANAGERWLRLDERAGGAMAAVGYGLIWWFLAGPVFTAIAGVFSSFLWEKLSLRVEQQAYGTAPEAKVPTAAIVFDSALRLMFSTLMCCFTVTCGWFFFLGAVFAGLLSLYDFTASAYLRRDVLFPAQMRKAFGCKGWLQFFIVCGVASLFPFINILLLPVFVAGGTLMVAETERGKAYTEL